MSTTKAAQRMNRERQRVIAHMLSHAMEAADIEGDHRDLMVDVFADMMTDLNEVRPTGFLLYFKKKPEDLPASITASR